MRDDVFIHVASENPTKIQAALEAVSKRYPNRCVQAKGWNVVSGVNEQPSNLSETMRGAMNRLRCMQKLMKNHRRIGNIIYISIENGLIFEHGDFYDVGVIIIETDEKSDIQLTRKVRIPTKAVHKALRRGFDSCTYADILVEMYDDPSIAKDPHLFLSGIPRQQYLEETISFSLEE